MKASQLERFKDTINHRFTSKFLFYAHFTADLSKRVRERLNLEDKVNLQEYFGMLVPEYVFPDPPANHIEPDFSKYYKNIEIPRGAFINNVGVLEIPGSSYHFTRFVSPLRDAETFKEFEEFPYPDLRDYCYDDLKKQVDQIHEKGRVAGIGVGHMYETAWQIRGYENFLEDMLLEPEKCEYILDRLKERNILLAEAAARSGCDSIMVGDDVANQRTLMFSREQWRKFMKPRWEEVFRAARKIKPDIQVWYHSDGNIMEVIPELLEIGVTILNPVQPECLNPVEVKQKFGHLTVMDGTIGTQTTMPFGTEDDVKKLVKERIETLGYDGALILSPTHVLEPEVPVENVLAFVDAVREYNGE